MSAQHTALLIPAARAAFEIGKRATPKPRPGQVLVRNKAVSLNPVDWVIQKSGRLFLEPFPAVVGSDGAGEIAQLGEGVTGWKIGDKVFYQSTFTSDRGTFQELTIADAARIAKVPDNLSYEQVVTLPLALATVTAAAYKPRHSEVRTADKHDIGGAGLIPPWEAEGRGKYAGQAAIIMSGSSSVGQFATQLAKLSGFSIIIATASKHNEEYCKSAGATHVIDYHDVPYPELPAAVKKIVGDVPLTYIYDAASSAESQKAGWDLLSPGGAMVVVLTPSKEIGTPGQDDDKGRRAVWVYGGINDPDHHEFGAGLYAALTEMLEKGELKPNKIENVGHGFEAITAGIAKLEKGVSGVKLVATL